MTDVCRSDLVVSLSHAYISVLIRTPLQDRIISPTHTHALTRTYTSPHTTDQQTLACAHTHTRVDTRTHESRHLHFAHTRPTRPLINAQWITGCIKLVVVTNPTIERPTNNRHGCRDTQVRIGNTDGQADRQNQGFSMVLREKARRSTVSDPLGQYYVCVISLILGPLSRSGQYVRPHTWLQPSNWLHTSTCRPTDDGQTSQTERERERERDD